ncbi:MAG: alpha/beta fold hydrolase [Clostridia bacterium]
MKPREAGYFEHEYCKPFKHEGSDNGILLIHGFSGCAARMRKLANTLAEKGYTVHSINLPGHATTEEDMAKTDWKQWLQAAKDATLDLLAKQKTVTVCGISMGGLLALIVAEQMKIDACVTISTPMAVKIKLMALAGIAAPFIKRIQWNESNEPSALLDSAYDFGYSGFPTQKAVDFNRLMKLARQNLSSVTCPVLCVQSDGDSIVWEGSADCILKGVSSKSRQKLWLHDVPHTCTISTEEPNIAEAIDALMTKIASEKTEA